MKVPCGQIQSDRMMAGQDHKAGAGSGLSFSMILFTMILSIWLRLCRSALSAVSSLARSTPLEPSLEILGQFLASF
jgi:hypothetical protein